MRGLIEVDDDLVAPDGAIVVTGSIIGGYDIPAIWIHGSISGSGASGPVIKQLLGAVEGVNAVIAVDGSLGDVYVDDPEDPDTSPEIQTNRSFGSSGAVSIHYDGRQSGETWHEDARVTISGTPYDKNTPAAKVWRVVAGMGDIDNDDDIDADDETAMGYAVDSLGSYASHYSGLQGSLLCRGNFQCTTPDEVIDEYDQSALAFYRYRNCFPDDCSDFGARRCDIVDPPNGVVDLSDLAALLGVYGKCAGVTISASPGLFFRLLSRSVGTFRDLQGSGSNSNGGFSQVKVIALSPRF